MTYEIKSETPADVLKQFEEDKMPEVLPFVVMPMTAYIRLADRVADLMQKGLMDGKEFYSLRDAMEEVDPYWRTR